MLGFRSLGSWQLGVRLEIGSTLSTDLDRQEREEREKGQIYFYCEVRVNGV